MSKKCVLHINKYYNPWIGGVERVVQDIAEGLADDFDMRVLVCNDAIRVGSTRERKNGVHITKAGTWTRAWGMPISTAFLQQFSSLAHDADMLHFHLPFPLGVLAARLYAPLLQEKRIVVTYHADIVRQRAVLPLYRPFQHALLRRADCIIVTSPPMKHYSDLPADVRTNAHVIPIGVDANGALSMKRGDKGAFLFVGRLAYYKGLECLVEAVSGTDLRVNIVGDGPLRDTLEARITSYGLENQVTLLGEVSDTECSRLYRRATALVFPSMARSEAFGIVQLEAMAHGLPVINTRLPTGVPWVARDGHEAMTVAPNDADALRNAMVTLANTPALRERLGKNGRQRAQTVFARREMLRAYQSMYLNI